MEPIQFKYKNTTSVADNEIAASFKKLSPYIEQLQGVAKQEHYEAVASFINTPFDKIIQQEVLQMVEQKKTTQLKYIVVIGIGGSQLGTKAIYDAIMGELDPFLQNRLPKILFMDTASPRMLDQLKMIFEEEVNDPDDIVINIISKSGTTIETSANFEALFHFVQNQLQNFGDIGKRIVVTTDHNSLLWKQAQEKGWSCLTVAKAVGGRFSVFTAVGLFPLAMTGIDTKELVVGAQIARDQCLSNDANINTAAISAAILYSHYTRGIKIHNSFFFNPELNSLGLWYRQLTAESLGKEYDSGGRKVLYSGITPLVSIGSSDLHSVAQLYIGGPKDKFTTFVYAPYPSSGTKNHGTIMNALYEGTILAYRNKKLSFMEILLPDVSVGALGGWMQTKMMEIIFLAKLMDVNAFDQPAVESYKDETRRILAL